MLPYLKLELFEESLVCKALQERKPASDFSLLFRLSFTSLNHLYLFCHFYLPGSIPFCVVEEYLLSPFVLHSVYCFVRAVCLLPFIFCWWENVAFWVVSEPRVLKHSAQGWLYHPLNPFQVHLHCPIHISIFVCGSKRSWKSLKFTLYCMLRNLQKIHWLSQEYWHAFTLRTLVHILEIVSKHPVTYSRLN